MPQSTGRTQRQIIWNPGSIPGNPIGIDAFREFADRAAAAGATHVMIGDVPDAIWQLRNRHDPHPEWASWPVWSAPNPGLFKLAVPPALEPWLPKEEAERNLEIIRERCEVLRGLGLRSTLYGNDPMWLPEEVFEAHPEWRGAQGEAMSLAHMPHYSPCIDHPEVLAMYRWAMGELCRTAPELDDYTFHSNDSAGGVCWAGSYPGSNGPEACRHRTLTERLVGFYDALQEGARDAGCEISVNLVLLSTPPPFDMAALQPGQYYRGKDAQGRPWAAATHSNGYFGPVYPLLGIPRVESFAEEMEKVVASAASRWHITFGPGVEPLLQEVYQELVAHRTKGPASRMVALRRVAETRVGKARAEDLLSVWVQIERAVTEIWHLRVPGSAGLLMLIAPLMTRWLITPLVPDRTQLSAEDKALFQRHRVASTQQEADSYEIVLGRPGFVGDSGVWVARNALNSAMTLFEGARQEAEKLVEAAVSDATRQELVNLTGSLRAFFLVCRSCRNIIDYAHTLATAGTCDEEVTWRDESGRYGMNRTGFELRGFARSEMDTARELADLIEQAPAPVLAMTARVEDEHALVFGPHLPAELRRKAQIMQEHMGEYNELYPPPNRKLARGEVGTMEEGE